MSFRKTALKDAVISLSLANLCFIGVWPSLLMPSYNSYLITNIQYIAVIISVLLLAVIFWGMAGLARLSANRIVLTFARIVFVSVLILPMWFVYNVIWPSSSLSPLANVLMKFLPFGKKGLIVIAFGLMIFGMGIIARWQYFLARIARYSIIVMSPCVILNFAQATWHLTSNNSYSSKQTNIVNTAPALHNTNGKRTRCVVLLFDEMDQAVAFPYRPKEIRLDEFDRLRNEAIYAKNAFPPAGLTMLSIPSLFSGCLVSKSCTKTSGDMVISTYGSSSYEHLSEQPTVFARVRNIGMKSALIGYIMPYQEMIGNQVDYVLSRRAQKADERVDLGEAMKGHFKKALCTTLPFALRLGLLHNLVTRREREADIYASQKFLVEAEKVLTDNRFDFVFVHFTVPHSPFIYDRSSNNFTISPKAGYLDNLVLTDRTLGELRSAMEAADSWDSTAILVTADHWWRDARFFTGKKDHRVPFILKLPGRKKGICYNQAFNNIITADLVIALLQGEITDNSSAVKWLDKHRSFAESPLTHSVL